MTGTFDAVINMFTSFGFLESDTEDQRVLRDVSRVLKRGGRFLIDFINREWVVRHYRPQRWRTAQDGSLLLQEGQFDLLTGRNRERALVIEPGGTRRAFHISIRMYAASELHTIVEAEGMRVINTWGDFDGSPLSLDSRRLIVLAEKPG